MLKLELQNKLIQAQKTIKSLQQEIKRLKQWVNDLQSGMYVNCVYCGHRYGPEKDTPVSMADVLKAHIEQCPEHPMSKLKQEIKQREFENTELNNMYKQLLDDCWNKDKALEQAREALEKCCKTCEKNHGCHYAPRSYKNNKLNFVSKCWIKNALIAIDKALGGKGNGDC